MRFDPFRTAILLVAVLGAVPLALAPSTPALTSTTHAGAPATALCDCFYYPNHLRAFREAKAIFIGEVIKVDRKAEAPEELGGDVTQAITFKVEQSWKGPKGRNVTAWENWTHTSCVDWKFEEGQKYLIYAEGRKGKLIVDGYCNRTRQIETKNAEALQEFAQLNDPVFLRKARR